MTSSQPIFFFCFLIFPCRGDQCSNDELKDSIDRMMKEMKGLKEELSVIKEEKLELEEKVRKISSSRDLRTRIFPTSWHVGFKIAGGPLAPQSPTPVSLPTTIMQTGQVKSYTIYSWEKRHTLYLVQFGCFLSIFFLFSRFSSH